MSFHCGSDSKESACNAGDPGSIPGSGRSPGEGNGNPLQYYCLENRRESDTTERLHFHWKSNDSVFVVIVVGSPAPSCFATFSLHGLSLEWPGFPSWTVHNLVLPFQAFCELNAFFLLIQILSVSSYQFILFSLSFSHISHGLLCYI